MQAHENPFATDRVERLLSFNPDWIGTSWDAIEQRWQQLGQRATITGRHGSGKTTFIDSWKKRLRLQGHQILHLFLNQQDRGLPASFWQNISHARNTTVILDGEEQLGWFARRQFHHATRHCAGLLVARHQPGQLPTLIAFDPDINLLHRCVRRLSPELYPALAPRLDTMWQSHHGNIRNILLECYDSARRLPG